MISHIQAFFLGALQGITEFLPVSSSGHLVFFQTLFGWKADDGIILAFDVVLHLGTLFAVLLAFRKDIADILTGKAWRLAGLLIVATIPAVIFGFTVKDIIETLFTSITVVGFAWIFTGVVLWLTKYTRSHQEETTPSFLKSVIIGCAQAVAIIPGVSRSGSTICAGLFCGLNKEAAAKFAFLMAIPAIAGGAVLDVKDIINFPREGLVQLLIGFLISFIVGYLSIKWLLNIIKKGHLWYFGIYCFGMGALVFILKATGTF